MKSRTLAVTIVFCLFAVPQAHAYWIWTPKTGKWVNPKIDAKSNPKEQFEFAKSLYEAKNLEDARREFKKVLRSFPKSIEAADSQYYIGRIEEDLDNLFVAYQEYQKVIDKYPFSERAAEIVEREYGIAVAYMEGKKRKTFGVSLQTENPAIEILTKVVANAPFGPLAAVAQYKLGVVLKDTFRYYEAEEAFNKVVTNYPESEWVQAAKFQIAAVKASLAKSPEYDQASTQEAKKKFKEFITEYPDQNLASKAEEEVNQLKEKEADSNYKIGLFYEKQKAYDSAKIYYEEVIKNSPDSKWAAKALERLRILEAKGR